MAVGDRIMVVSCLDCWLADRQFDHQSWLAADARRLRAQSLWLEFLAIFYHDLRIVDALL